MKVISLYEKNSKTFFLIEQIPLSTEREPKKSKIQKTKKIQYDSVSDNVPQVRTLSEKINFSLEINVSDNWNILGLLSQVLEDM